MSKRKFVNANLNEILQNKSSKSTIYQQNSAFRSFQEFLSFKSLDINLKTISLKDLDLLLRDFYASLRNGNELYKRNSYLSMRQALNRQLKTIIDPQIDIVNDKGNFPMSIELFGCLLKTVKKEGRGNTDHYSEISRNDFQAISEKLDVDVPQQLQWFVFIITGLFFARRGCENYDKMKVSDFEFGVTAKGRRYVCMKRDELTKNHRENDTEKLAGGMIIQTCHAKCPFTIFEKYVGKLNPLNPYLWQRCRDTYLTDDNVWYENRKIGVNIIRQFMSKVSIFCNLSKTYTNHCLRVSSCTILGESHSENDIKSISGHASNSALGIYKRIKESKKEEMALDLAKAMGVGTSEEKPSSSLLEKDDEWLLNEVRNFEFGNEKEHNHSNYFYNCNVTINCSK